jgi:hypothetical protein
MTVTGSGNFAYTRTLTGTTNVTFPTTGTLSTLAGTETFTNKTLTGAIVNGTVGATTPAAGAFTTLTTSSTVTLNGGTANGVTYLDGSKVLTSGSALVFDGSNLGLGVTPSAWQTASGSRAIQFTGSGVYGYRDTNLMLTQNAYLNTSGDWTYYASSIAPAYYTIGSGSHQWYRAASGTAGNAITFSESMRIDSSGNLLINSTSTLDAVVSVVGRVGANAAPFSLRVGTTGDYGFTFKNDAGTFVGAIGVNSSTTSYVTSSDYRLKENIAPMVGALATVSQLKPCTYTWKVDGAEGQGFIAHELAEVCPYAVVGEKDAVDADGNIKSQGIDTSFLVATLTAAIQEQQALITQLQADVATLKGN